MTFIVMAQVDRLFEWESKANTGIRDALQRQQPHVNNEFETNLQRAILNLNEQGLNVALYWKNPDPRKYVNIVPTSAISGEGIPDMLQLVVQLTQVLTCTDSSILAVLLSFTAEHLRPLRGCFRNGSLSIPISSSDK